jgi:hypothetical protein
MRGGCRGISPEQPPTLPTRLPASRLSPKQWRQVPPRCARVRFSPSDYFLKPSDYLVAVGLLVLGFVIREFVFRAGGSVWEDLRHLFDIEVPQELEAFATEGRSRLPRPPERRRNCRRCGAAIVFGDQTCDTCERLGIPPEPELPAWEPPSEVLPMDFAAHSTWAAPRTVPHRVLGPAVLRLKIAMGAVLLTTLSDLLLSGFAAPGWLRVFLVGAAIINVFLLFAIRHRSIAALIIAPALLAVAAFGELTHPDLGWLALLVWALEISAIGQAYPAIRHLRRARGRPEPDSETPAA